MKKIIIALMLAATTSVVAAAPGSTEISPALGVGEHGLCSLPDSGRRLLPTARSSRVRLPDGRYAAVQTTRKRLMTYSRQTLSTATMPASVTWKGLPLVSISQRLVDNEESEGLSETAITLRATVAQANRAMGRDLPRKPGFRRIQQEPDTQGGPEGGSENGIEWLEPKGDLIRIVCAYDA